jgi:hypothetical protein
MRKICPLVAVLILAWMAIPMFVRAGQGDATPTEQWIERLGSPNFAERERAVKALRGRGPSVLPVLRKSSDKLDLETRRRLQEIIAFLEAELALAPKRVTLADSPQTLGSLLAAIEKQTKIKMRADDQVDDQTLYRCTIKDRTFWEAVEQIGRDTGRFVSVKPGDPVIQLKRLGRRPPLVYLQGAFQLEAMRIHEDREFDFTRPDKAEGLGVHEHGLTLTIRVLVEPRMHLLSVDRVDVETAVDEHGESLAKGTPKPRILDFGPSVGRPWRLEPEKQKTAEILLQRASAKARAIKDLRGALHVRIVAERKKVVITEKFLEALGTTFQASGQEIQITQVHRQEDGIHRVRITVPRSAPGVQMRWHERLFLEDAKGNPCTPVGFGEQLGGAQEWHSVDFRADKDAPPATKLIFEDWVVVRHTISFTFKDVPLP